MSLLASGIIAGAKVAGGLISKKRAKKKGAEAEAEINAQTAVDSAELQKGIDAQQRAEKDLGNVYEGMTSISPEAQYARDQSERGTSSAIDKAMRSGSSTGSIMNMVSGLTAQGQRQGQAISAQENARRREAAVAAKGQGIKAAQTGLAGKQAQIALKDKAYGRTMQKQDQINRASAQNYNFYSGALGDLGSAFMMNKMYGGGIDPVTGVGTPGMSLGKEWQSIFGKGKKKSKSNPYVGGGYSGGLPSGFSPADDTFPQ